jgi:hypothetical protein
MVLYHPYFLGFFFVFSLSYYGIPFLCPNDLHVQVSGHLIPILNIYIYIYIVLLHVLFFWNLIVVIHVIFYSIFFVLVFRCFFRVNYPYSNSFRTENRWFGLWELGGAALLSHEARRQTSCMTSLTCLRKAWLDTRALVFVELGAVLTIWREYIKKP